MATLAVLESQNKILLIRRSVKTSRSGQWCFPGGGVKENETPGDACAREAKEETGLDIPVIDFVVNINGNSYFKCQKKQEDQEINLKLNECDDFSWVEPYKLLEIGMVMDLKNVYRVLSVMGYEIKLNDEAKQIIR